MRRRLSLCALLIALGTGLSLQCSSFSGSDVTASGTNDAGSDASTSDGGGALADGASLDAGGPPTPICQRFPDAALCLDFDEAFPPMDFSRDPMNGNPAHLAITDGGYSPPSAFLATVTTVNEYAQLYEESAIAIPPGKSLHFRAQIRAPLSAYSNTEVDLFLLETSAGPGAAFFIILDSPTTANHTATFNYGFAASGDGGALCSGPTGSVPTTPGEWFPVDIIHDPTSNNFTVTINGQPACTAAPLTSYLPPAGNGAQAPFRADLGIGYAAMPPQSVAIDDVVVTFE